MKKNILIGITGGIGSGKSLLRDYLASHGEYVICADQVSRDATLPGNPGNESIRRFFGDEYFLPGGELDRKKLADNVFCNKYKLDMLNNILHPLIKNNILIEAGHHKGRVFIEAPLLIQADMHKDVDFVWLIIADLETKIRRVMQRSGLSMSEVMQRIESQMSDEEMSVYADEIIDNSGSIQGLYQKIDELLKKPEYKG